MGILSKKQQPLLNETNAITEEYQKNSLKVVEKIKEVKEKERKMKIQFKDYQIEIDELNKELENLSNQQLFETDPEKIKNLESKRKDIRLTIDDKKQLLNVNLKPFLLKDLDVLDEVIKDATAEYQKFQGLAQSEIDEINNQINELKKKRSTLFAAKSGSHIYPKAIDAFIKLKKEYGSSAQG